MLVESSVFLDCDCLHSWSSDSPVEIVGVALTVSVGVATGRV